VDHFPFMQWLRMAGPPALARGLLRRSRRRRGFDGVEAQAQARLVPVGAGAMDDARFGGFVQRGTEQAKGRGGVLLFARAEEIGVFPFQGVEAGFDSLVLQMLARAVSHAAPG